MSEQDSEDNGTSLVFEYRLDAPPEKVWRAISIPQLREQWLPAPALAQAEAVATRPGEEVQYRLRDDEPPFLESLVTLKIRPAARGGTVLRIVHQVNDPRLAANDGSYRVLCAA